MHVAFFGTFGLWAHHTGTELEIAERHLEAGDEVTWVLCDAAFASCEPNPGHDAVQCRACRMGVERGLGLLGGEVRVLELSKLLTDEDRRRLEGIPIGIGSMEELKGLYLDECDIGWGALSSAVWLAKDANIDPAGELVDRLLRTAGTAYLGTRRLLENHAIDRVYAFNGRMAPMRGILRGARSMGVDCFIHERGKDLQHYGLFENAMPHDIAATRERVEAVWAGSEHSEEERRTLGAGWFEGRPRGQMGSWISFVRGQSQNELPDTWDPARHNVALFTTTEHEFVSIGKEWESPLFESPHAATVAIARAISELPGDDVHLTIRIHPNPEGAKSSNVSDMVGWNLRNVTVIPPDSAVSTYALMREANVVVTSGSTAGIEATFWQRPSVLAGRGLYAGLGAAYEPASMEELMAMLVDRSLPVADRDGALRYGYYQATRGIPYRFFEPDGLFEGAFKGQEIKPTRMQRKLLRFHRKVSAFWN
ncbi:hypothetical protein [Planctomycetes bacterium Poly30]